jgi:hypothetical protein
MVIILLLIPLVISVSTLDLGQEEATVWLLVGFLLLGDAMSL